MKSVHLDAHTGILQRMSSPIINASAVRFLLSLLRTKSLTDTASALSMNISSASRLLRDLREEFNDELFARSYKALVPTPRMLELEDKLKELLVLLNAMRGPSDLVPENIRGTFAIGAVDNALCSIFPVMLAPIVERCPHLTFSIVPITCPDFFKEMLAGTIDMVLYPLREDAIGESFRYLTLHWREAERDVQHFVHVVRHKHPLAQKSRAGGTVTREDLARYRRIRIESVYRKTGTSPSYGEDFSDVHPYLPAVSTNYFLGAIHMMLATECTLLLPEPTALALAPHFDFEILRFERPIVATCPKLIWHASRSQDPAHLWLRSEMMRLWVSHMNSVAALYKGCK